MLQGNFGDFLLIKCYSIYIPNQLLLFICRIDQRSLMLIMKFVYNFANMNDVDTLYEKIQKADLKIPLKDLSQFKASVHLGQPLAISNYLKGLDQFERLPTNFKNQHWDIKSTLGSKYVFPNFNVVS